MSPEFQSAGINILRYVYQTCEELKLDKAQIPELLTALTLAVAHGQHDGPEPLPPRKWGAKLTDEYIREIRRRCAAGETRSAIARALGLDYMTVVKYTEGTSLDGNIRNVESPAQSALSNATDRPADHRLPKTP